MSWLDDPTSAGHEVLRYEQLAQFRFEGERVPLIDSQRGIRKPAQLRAALSIRTRFTPTGQMPPYEDVERPDGLLRYKYRGDDVDHSENVALRTALERGCELIWFVGAARGSYVAVDPIWIVGDEPEHLQFVVAFDMAQRLVQVGRQADVDQRQYVERLTRQRLHQPVFRAKVLLAYDHRCSMCQLRYPRLLDAAHILPDGHPHGQPVVPNGIALCKIHHAAFDQNLVGLRPDLIVEVRDDVAHDTDGPMLVHGLQEMEGAHLYVPRVRPNRPDPERLE